MPELDPEPELEVEPESEPEPEPEPKRENFVLRKSSDIRTRFFWL